jgi:hypothetical protein
LLRKTFIALAAAGALGCVPVATTASAAGHPGGHASVGHVGASGMSARGGHAVGVARSGHAAGSARGGRVARYGRGYGGYGGYGRGPIYNGPIYDSCEGYGYGYGYNRCPGYGVPIVGRVINDVLGGYGPH